MIFDLKYHIASLVAVFLALGIGILIGSTMLGNNTILETQKQLTNNLVQQLEILREKNEAVKLRANTLEVNNNILKEFSQEVLPIVLENRLAGQKIAIIKINNSIFTDNLKNIFNMAGAEVSSVTTVVDGFNLSDDKVLPAAINLTPDVDQHKIIQTISQAVADGIISGQNTEIINSLKEKGFLKIEGTYEMPINAVVIIGGSKDKKSVKLADIDFPIINYFVENNVSVYGVEESETVYSYMKDYQKKRISTVDNIDSVPGQVALVFAMQGSPGHYGIKDTAHRLLPPIGVAANVQ